MLALIAGSLLVAYACIFALMRAGARADETARNFAPDFPRAVRECERDSAPDLVFPTPIVNFR